MRQKQIFTLGTQLRQRQRNTVLWGTVSLFFAILLLIGLNEGKKGQEKAVITYYFLPVVDHDFANPSNWIPSYPGSHIGAEQQIVIEGEATIELDRLEVKGLLQIGLGASLRGPGCEIRINKGGKLNNDGKLVLETLLQSGNLNNNYTGSIDLHSYRAVKGARSYNLLGAEFFVSDQFLNEGEFNNYGTFVANKEFTNSHQFRHLGDSRYSLQTEWPKSRAASFFR